MERTLRRHSNCLQCNKEIIFLVSQRSGKYCSKKCWGLHKRKTTNCLTCKKEFSYPVSRLKQGKAKFCSVGCYHKYIYKGGITLTKDGYIRYVKTKQLQHRYVMEKYLRRELTKNEEVHHINGIKGDNRLENLEVVIKSMHYGRVKCPHCNKKFKVK